MKLIITEKPSVAKDIARVLNISTKENGYYKNDVYAITWAYGHLIELAPPDHYGFPKKWCKEVLPILPEKFKLICRQKKDKDGVSANDPDIEKQLAVIDSLFKKSESLIVATDAGREGELIFRYIYEYLGCDKSFKRLWISSMTDKAILEGFKQLKEGKEYDSLYLSARARSESDWLVGINGTQALSLAVNKGLLSLGRVQTPTLSIICRRYNEFVSFKSRTYYIVKIVCLSNKTTEEFSSTLIDNEEKNIQFDKKVDAEELIKSLNHTAEVMEHNQKTIKENAPLLYDLSSLQQDANKRFGISADNTLSAAQELYEKKLISYPRTGSRYISEDVFETIPELINEISTNLKFKEAAEVLKGKKLNTRSVDDEKITDHHALLPTGKHAHLEATLEIIYNLITARFLEAFEQACHKNLTTVKLQVETKDGKNNLFIAKGTEVIIPGWRNVSKYNEEETEEKKLPLINKGDLLEIISTESEEQKTKPKPLHTEASLLKEMETCGKEIDDEELSQAMKATGLGTPATRASIIETLFDRKYIERRKKSLVPTELGLFVFDLTKDKKIGQPLLTGELEKKLEEIRIGDIHEVEDFMQEMKQYTSDLTHEMLQVGPSSLPASKVNLVCPKCKKGQVIIREKAAGCSEYKSGCTFTIWRKIASKSLSDNEIKALILTGKTKEIKGFTNKEEKKFNAQLVLDDNCVVKFKFLNKKNF